MKIIRNVIIGIFITIIGGLILYKLTNNMDKSEKNTKYIQFDNSSINSTNINIVNGNLHNE